MKKSISTKLTAILMMIAMIITMIPMTAFADETDTVTVSRIDINNVWTALDTVNPVDFTAEVNPGDAELTEQIYVANETWTDTSTGDVLDYSNVTIPEGEHTYRYSILVNTYYGYQFDENLTLVYGGNETEATMNFSDDMTSVMISGFVDDVYVEPYSGGGDDTQMFAPLNVVVNDTTTNLNGAVLSVAPSVLEDLYDNYGIAEDSLTEEEKTAFVWRYAIGEMFEGETLTINISDRAVTDEEKEIISTNIEYIEGKPVKIAEPYTGISVSMDLDGTPITELYNGIDFTLSDVTIPENTDTIVPNYVDNAIPVQIFDAEYAEDTIRWTGWNAECLDFIFASAVYYDTMTKPVDLVEINGATLSFKAGDNVVFTGKIDSDIYNMNDYTFEYWENPQGVIAVSSETVKADEYYDGFSKFDYDTTYKYNVGVEINRDKYLEEGYYFTEDVQLKLNGKIYDNIDKYVSDDGWSVEFHNVASFTTEKKPVTIVDISKATVSIAGQKYTGKALTPDAKVVVNGATLKKGTDYTVSYKNNMNAGTATATITGKGNYKGTVNKTFNIAKAKNGMIVKAKKIKATVGKKKTVKKAKAFTVKKANGKVTFKKTKGNKKITVSKAGKVTVKKGLKAGTYKVKVKVTAAGDANHNSKSKTVTMKVTVK